MLMAERDYSGSPHIDLCKSKRFLVFLLSHAKWRKDYITCLPRFLNAQGACFRHAGMCRKILSKVTFIFFIPPLENRVL